MAGKNDELLKRLLATFRIEADEHLKAMSSALAEMGKNPAAARRMELIEKVFREAHSLKGAARSVNLTEIELVCQSLESVFSALKDRRLAVSPSLLDLLQQATDALGGLLASKTGATEDRRPAVAALVRRLDDALKKEAREGEASAPISPTTIATAPTKTSAPGPAAETVRISTVKLDAVMRQVEELLAPRLASGERVRELREITALFTVWKRQRAQMQPALRLIERSFARSSKGNGASAGQQALSKLFEYLENGQLFMKTIEGRLAQTSRSAEHDRRTLAAMTDNLLQDVKEMHLLPFFSLLEAFPRFARELARDQGKDVELAIQGGEIEIDRRILEEMKAPLIHMIRNGIDHGIETPATRQAGGKPPRGTITLAISQKDGRTVEILVADDGSGIDAVKVRAVAVKLGIVAAEEAEQFDRRDALALVFHSGVTTSPIITDVSGRGLGLAIVREKVERLGGAITLESSPETGTAFRIALPLTLATFRGVLVRIGERLFVIPTAGVERVTRVAQEDIRTVENRETILLDRQAVPLVRLSDALGLPRAGETAGGRVPTLVLALGSGRVAFRVDEILGEQEVLVKPLGRQLARVRNVVGASILGTGQVVPILNVPDLLKSAVKRAAAPLASAPAPTEQPAAAAAQSILVVEDSITARSLLKGILESAGYRVATAVDGIDAFTALKTGSFDLVVSDVDMPRMNGFDLTAKVRSDKKLADLPIVLVTALESREHRERGIDVGANAYIVKSSFDQSNLLEVVRRLV